MGRNKTPCKGLSKSSAGRKQLQVNILSTNISFYFGFNNFYSRLSERNCIEIINKLIELEMITVYHTLDGKEFITQHHLEKEIYDELYVHEGIFS